MSLVFTRLLSEIWFFGLLRVTLGRFLTSVNLSFLVFFFLVRIKIVPTRVCFREHVRQ